MRIRDPQHGLAQRLHFYHGGYLSPLETYNFSMSFQSSFFFRDFFTKNCAVPLGISPKIFSRKSLWVFYGDSLKEFFRFIFYKILQNLISGFLQRMPTKFALEIVLENLLNSLKVSSRFLGHIIYQEILPELPYKIIQILLQGFLLKVAQQTFSVRILKKLLVTSTQGIFQDTEIFN